MSKKAKDWVNTARVLLLVLLPFLAAGIVWSTSLSFVPVPWPDDSAFYFVAKEFFKWPPRWVMLPQAAFESTYRIFNFNTMPIFPILIGLGRWIGLDGSHPLKVWPLSAWALTGALLGVILYRRKLPWAAALAVSLVFALDPLLRWASVLIRPESLIGLIGMALILGLTFGFPKKLHPKGLWDPISALLALGALVHFNAIHLVAPVFLTLLIEKPKRIFAVGWRTVLYLSPWLLAVVLHFDLFVRQLSLQWARLAIHNSWLDSPTSMIQGLYDSMGSPEPWPSFLYWTSFGLWLLIFGAAVTILPAFANRNRNSSASKMLVPSATWVLSGVWLWHSKPEVWFKYYIHTSLWCFTGVLGWTLWNATPKVQPRRTQNFYTAARLTWLVLVVSISGVYLKVNLSQLDRLSHTASWHWKTYDDFVDCVDQRLSRYEKSLPHSAPFQVWFPTFPDITIEISRRHPQWELSRTNDFWERRALAIEHGKKVDAVVVTETIGEIERTLSGDAKNYPEIVSAWMVWRNYFLNTLWITPDWKPNRYLCQRGRWQAFLFLENEPNSTALKK